MIFKISIICSFYSHPDVYHFYTMNIVQEIEYLLRCECIIFAYASKVYSCILIVLVEHNII